MLVSSAELFLGYLKLVFGPLLFNIYLDDLFCITYLKDVCNFADDAAFHACQSSLENFVKPTIRLV